MKIAFVGESWGGDEETESAKAKKPMPFVGAAGKLFNSLLKTCGIHRSFRRGSESGRLFIEQDRDILVTNVFNIRPERNKIENIFVSKKESSADDRALEWPALARGSCLDPKMLPEIDRLLAELANFRPDAICALGATPLWALCKVTGIMKRRGGYHETKIGSRAVPVIPTIHPAAVLRSFIWFVLVAHDIERTVAVARGARPERWKFIAEPTIADLARLKTMKGPLANDIETLPAFRAITCIGIGNADEAICVPFVDHSKPGRSYWSTPEQEKLAWLAVRECLEDRSRVKIGQNYLYDLTWQREIAGIEVRGQVWDTRLMHHSLWPELPHDLWSIASTPLLVEPWKQDFQSMKADD